MNKLIRGLIVPLLLINEDMEEKLELEFNKIVEELTPILDNLKNERSNIYIFNEKNFTEIDEYGTMVIALVGGLNGHGKWEDYFEDLAKIITTIKENGYDTWVIDLVNDCLDDVFTVKLGIMRNE
jgi:hypothetical protein